MNARVRVPFPIFHLQHIISETVRSAHLRADIEEKDNLIEELRGEIETMKEEFAKVKKRNKQLAFIISQGESKLGVLGLPRLVSLKRMCALWPF